MRHLHTPTKPRGHKTGCRCAHCQGEFERRQSAATQFYSLLDMRWIGIRTAIAYAEFARQGIEEAFPPQAQDALGLLRQHSAGVLNNLLADILD